MISNSRRFTIGGQARIHTYGDQYNDSTVIKADIVHVRQALSVRKCKEGWLDDNEYEQFHEIIRGDLYSVRELRGLEKLNLDELHQQQRKNLVRYIDPRTFHVSKIRGEDGRFTVVYYHGEDAQETWRRDFLEYSQVRSPSKFQLFGINRSKIPALIFHDEMVPLPREHPTFCERMFISMLMRKLRCTSLVLWINSKTGCISSGLALDTPGIWFQRTSISLMVPSTTEMLEEDVFLRYVGKHGSSMLDEDALEILETCYYTPLHDLSFSETQGGPIRGLSFGTIYTGSLQPIAKMPKSYAFTWNWELWGWPSCFIEERVLNGGSIKCLRFDRRTRIRSCDMVLWTTQDRSLLNAWLSQSHSILALDGEIANDASTYYTLKPRYEIQVRQRGEDEGISGPPGICDIIDSPHVYLFLRTPTSSTADISALQTWLGDFDEEYYWSLDENGETPISEHTQRTLDLPILIPRLVVRKYGWQREAYRNVYKYQKARGFDPRTAQFAGSIGLYELESLVREGLNVGNERFEDKHDSSFPSWTSWWKTKRNFFDMW